MQKLIFFLLVVTISLSISCSNDNSTDIKKSLWKQDSRFLMDGRFGFRNSSFIEGSFNVLGNISYNLNVQLPDDGLIPFSFPMGDIPQIKVSYPMNSDSFLSWIETDSRSFSDEKLTITFNTSPSSSISIFSQKLEQLVNDYGSFLYVSFFKGNNYEHIGNKFLIPYINNDSKISLMLITLQTDNQSQVNYDAISIPLNIEGKPFLPGSQLRIKTVNKEFFFVTTENETFRIDLSGNVILSSNDRLNIVEFNDKLFGFTEGNDISQEYQSTNKGDTWKHIKSHELRMDSVNFTTLETNIIAYVKKQLYNYDLKNPEFVELSSDGIDNSHITSFSLVDTIGFITTYSIDPDIPSRCYSTSFPELIR